MEKVNIKNREEFTYLYIYNLYIGTESQMYIQQQYNSEIETQEV